MITEYRLVRNGLGNYVIQERSWSWQNVPMVRVFKSNEKVQAQSCLLTYRKEQDILHLNELVLEVVEDVAK